MKITGDTHRAKTKIGRKKTRAGTVKLDLTHKDGNFKIKQQAQNGRAASANKTNKMKQISPKCSKYAALLLLKKSSVLPKKVKTKKNLLSNVKLYVSLFFIIIF